ncbi:MAG TPA: YcnI family protein [Gaiellaceae bacterium]|nr:YcnI family protein [Gaiellaceae bacterium]
MRRLILFVLAVVLIAPAGAAAHVTIQPGNWEAGAFARMAFRVPNERDDAETVSITVQFPENVPTARFQYHPVCERETETQEDTDAEGETIQRVISVTWTCDPAIAVDGFDELGISFRVPEDAAPGDEILFPTTQVYSSGEEVGWIDPDPEADSPAPRITIEAPEEEPEEEAPAADDQAADGDGATDEAAAPVVETDDSNGMEVAAIIFGIVGLAAGLIALGVALFRKPTTT